MGDAEINYAKRANERKAAREALRPTYTADDVRKMVTIACDRWALSMLALLDHEPLVRSGDMREWMKHHEKWVEDLLDVEPPSKGIGRPRDFDYYRRQQRYKMLRSGIRTLIRNQLEFPPEIKLD